MILIFGEKFKKLEFVFIGILLVSIFVNYSFYSYVSQIYAGLIMITSISLLTLVLFKLASKVSSSKNKLLALLLMPVLILSSSIIAITALLSSVAFYTSTDLFYGVKISLVIPIITSIINYNIVFWKFKTINEIGSKIIELSKRVNRATLILICAFLLIFLAYYIVRTGKSNFILPIEDIFRKTLTDIFGVRPRLKEFLIGYPAFFAFVYFSTYKKDEIFMPIFGILSTILFTSILNTFCHTFADFVISFQRVMNGFLCGLIITAIIMLIMMICKSFYNKKIFFDKKY
jgi:hypothetical protein